MQPSPKQPDFFIDRSLGRKQIPDALRARGFVVHTMFSVFGAREESVSDAEWLEIAGRNRWLVLTKDDQIRRNPAEIAAIQAHSARVLCITSANLTGALQVSRILQNLTRIIGIAEREVPPYVYGIYASEIRKLWPKQA